MKKFIAVAVLLFVSQITQAYQFYDVTKDIYRGARPFKTGLDEVSKFGIKTIVDLEESGNPAIAEEKQYAESIGLKFYSFPMLWNERPDDQSISTLLKLLQNPKNFPILVHCKRGQDRTGLVIGLYRTLVQFWMPAQAYQEMLSYNFHPEYTALTEFFAEKTGYHP